METGRRNKQLAHLLKETIILVQSMLKKYENVYYFQMVDTYIIINLWG